MVIEIGKILITCSDTDFLSTDGVFWGYQKIPVTVQAEHTSYSLTLHINDGLDALQKVQAVVVTTLRRLTTDPQKNLSIPYPYLVSKETRKRDWNGGFWTKLISSHGEDIPLDSFAVVGLGKEV